MKKEKGVQMRKKTLKSVWGRRNLEKQGVSSKNLRWEKGKEFIFGAQTLLSGEKKRWGGKVRV